MSDYWKNATADALKEIGIAKLLTDEEISSLAAYMENAADVERSAEEHKHYMKEFKEEDPQLNLEYQVYDVKCVVCGHTNQYHTLDPTKRR